MLEVGGDEAEGEGGRLLPSPRLASCAREDHVRTRNRRVCETALLAVASGRFGVGGEDGEDEGGSILPPSRLESPAQPSWTGGFWCTGWDHLYLEGERVV
jgi:hypothetical protein